MTLQTVFREYIAACFTGLYIQCHEHEDALTEIAQLCRNENWRLTTWDIAQGLQTPGQAGEAESAATDPLAAIQAVKALATTAQFEVAVLVGCDGIQQLAKLILRGENYVGMSLEEAARDYLRTSLTKQN